MRGMGKNQHTAAGAALSGSVLDLFKLSSRMLAAGDRLVASLGLTSARWQVLGTIVAAEQPQPVAWLARDMGANRQNVQRIVNDLEREGLVGFAPNPHHRRASLVVLTDKGRQAFEAGRVLGCFHTLLEDFDTALLCEALPGFHDLNSYRDGYLRAISRHRRQTGSAFSFCRTMIEDRLEADSLSDRAARTGATVTVTHGDPKLDNFLFDRDSHEAVSLIDLDTTSSGPAVMDIGDCLRSLGNPEGEKGAPSAVRFDCRTVERFLDGYGRSFLLGDADRHLIYHAVRMLTYELGLRFFTDYLEGDRYFKVGSADENLRRAVVQFTLLASIEAQRSALEALAWAS